MALPLFQGWRSDGPVLAACASALVAYYLGTVYFRRLRGRRWPAARWWWFGAGAVSALIAIESPLDAAGDSRFAPHMLQHLILTDISAPCILLSGPLLLLSVGPNRAARAAVLFLNGPIGRALTFPVLTWTVFIVSLWTLHYSGFFELALESESVHVLEHAVFLIAALLFWLPIIGVGPLPQPLFVLCPVQADEHECDHAALWELRLAASGTRRCLRASRFGKFSRMYSWLAASPSVEAVSRAALSGEEKNFRERPSRPVPSRGIYLRGTVDRTPREHNEPAADLGSNVVWRGNHNHYTVALVD